MTTRRKTEPQGVGKLLIDLGPLLIFFLVNFLAPVPAVLKIFVATGAFMIAMVIAMIFSALRFGKISPMLWFSGLMVVVLGGLTIWLHNETFIKMKPTIYYSLTAAILSFGLFTGKPLLKTVLEASFPGLDGEGWIKLTRNWAVFFVALAILNEIVWRNSSTDFWVGFKLWGVIPATMIFTFANLPMMIRHGMRLKDAQPTEPGPFE
jgi:intracellular septation protein